MLAIYTPLTLQLPSDLPTYASQLLGVLFFVVVCLFFK